MSAKSHIAVSTNTSTRFVRDGLVLACASSMRKNMLISPVSHSGIDAHKRMLGECFFTRALSEVLLAEYKTHENMNEA